MCMEPSGGHRCAGPLRRIALQGARARSSLAVISLAALPMLAACATASPNDFTADAYPAQTIGDAFKSSLEPSPPPAGPAASPNCPAAPAGQRGPAGPVGACSAAAAARAPSIPPTD